MKKNKWFKESEFDCKCGKCKRPANVPSAELVDILCEIREFFNAPVRDSDVFVLGKMQFCSIQASHKFPLF